MDVLLSFPPFPPPPIPLSDDEFDVGMTDLLKTLRDVNDNILKYIDGPAGLNMLNADINTVVYAFALTAIIKSNGLPMPDLFDRLVNFLNNFDRRQIRYVGEHYRQIVQTTYYLAERLSMTDIGAMAISNAILKIDPDASTFTTYHLLAVQLAISSGRPESVLHLITRPIYYFPAITKSIPSSDSTDRKLLSSTNQHPSTFITIESGLTARPRYHDVMEYFFLVADAHIRLRQWEQALDALETVILHPVKDNVPSKIMVDAYKRFCLIHCICHGSSHKFVSAFPTISVQMTKTIRAVAKPYEAVTSLFDTLIADAEPIDALISEIEAGETIWTDECNMGLIQLLIGCFSEYKIKNLANTFHKISIYDIASAANMPGGTKPWQAGGTEDMVIRMIEQGQISATIEGSPKDEVVCFKPNGTLLSDEDFAVLVQDSTSRLARLTAEVKKTDARISCDPNYLYSLARHKSKPSARGKDNGIDDFNSGVPFTGEEDLMSDD